LKLRVPVGGATIAPTTVIARCRLFVLLFSWVSGVVFAWVASSLVAVCGVFLRRTWTGWQADLVAARAASGGNGEEEVERPVVNR
jgi:hypothetical protein